MKKATALLTTLLVCSMLLRAQKPELVLPTLHAAPISELSFSADGKYLASCAGNEIKLWEVASGRLLRTILAPDPIEHIALSKDGARLVSCSYCGVDVHYHPYGEVPELNTDVRVWDMVTGKPIRTLKSFGKPVCLLDVGISPDMKYAFAYFEGGKTDLAGKISIWDLNTGKEQGTLPKGADVAYESVSFSADSKHLLLMAPDTVRGGWGKQGIPQWADWATGKTENIFEESCRTVCSAGDEVIACTVSGFLKRWNTLDKTRSTDQKLDIALGEDDKIVYDGFVFSSDGTRLCILSKVSKDSGGLSYDYHRFRIFDTQSGALVSDRTCAETSYKKNGAFASNLGLYVAYPRPPEFRMLDALLTGMKAYSTATGAFSHPFGLTSLEATIVANALSPTNNQVFNQGKLLFINRDSLRGMGPHPRYHTIFLPESGQVITGVETDSLPFFTAGQSLTEDKRWKLEFTGGASYQLTDTRSGQVVATLLLADAVPAFLDEVYPAEYTAKSTWTDASSTTWAVTTPSGLFDASPDMMKSLHYVTGMEVIALDQLKERYYEPGLLAKILGLDKGELRNVAALNNVALYPEITASIAEGQVKVSLRARSGGMGKLSLFVNGKEVIEDANPSRLATLSIDLQPFEKYWQPGSNAIALRAYNQEGWLKSQAYELTYAPIEETKAAQPSTSTAGGPTKPFGGAKPHLYVLSIGTANYSGDKMDLNFPDLDAAAMATALQSTGSRLFDDRVHLRLLSTLPAEARSAKEGAIPSQISSKANIEAAFKEFAAQAKPQDVLVVYFSGHGITYTAAEKAQFYYLTKDIGSPELSDKAIRDNYTVSSDDLTHWLTAITAKKQVMILDACNSGKVVESLATIGARALNSSQIVALDRMKDRTGMFILTGAAADKVSYEASQYGQGLLTYSLLQGMSGLALTPDKRVDVMTLFQYSRDQVPGLAKGIDQVQVPMLAFPAGGGSFDIGIVDATVKIPVSQVKPVFIRNNFQDEASFDDVLGLTPALADYFRGITVKGAKAELIYVDVTEYANAYSMKGRYTINGDAVEVRGRLFKGKEAMGEFQVAGKKDDVPGLAQLILAKVRPLMK